MRIKLHPGPAGLSLNGNKLAPDEFGYVIGGQHMPGFTGEPREIVFPCKGGRYSHCILNIHRAAPNEATRTWQWDGNVEEPTLVPSIGCDHRCGWHGHLSKGVLIP